MIPPVEERQVRPCAVCCFIWQDDYLDNYCNLHIYIPADDRPKDAPCKYNYTSDEMKERIDKEERE